MYFTKSFINKVFRLGILLTIVLILLDILTYFYYPDTVIGEIFLATREQTPLTWVSAIILFLIALSSATVYMKNKGMLWYFISIIFLFFSMDDATYFHERFSSALQELIPLLASFPSYSWIILYLPLLVFSLGALIFLLWKNASPKEKRLLRIAFFALAVSLLLDMVDGWVGKDRTLVFCLESRCDSIVEHFFRLLEESLEVFGFGILAYLNINKHTIISEFDS